MKMPRTSILLLGPLLAAGTALGQVRIAALEGSATRVAGGAESPLKIDDVVAAGDEIQVGADGRVEATLADGSVVRLGPGSRLRIEDASFAPETKSLGFRARLAAGKVWSSVVKLVGGGKFEVETDNGVAGVRGTEFAVSTGAEGTSVDVYKGTVFFGTTAKGAEGGGVSVTRGQRVQVAQGALSRGGIPADDAFGKWVRERQKLQPDKEDRLERRRERLQQRRERVKEEHLRRR